MLKQRGLIIDDEKEELNYLSIISYFRLASYLRPLEEDKINHIFKPGKHFSNAISLYFFDKELRIVIFSALQSIEIAIRTKINHHYSMKYGPFWFMDSSLAGNQDFFSEVLNNLSKEITRSKEDFIKEHFQKYDEPVYPPSWKTLEVASFGTLAKLYCNINDNKLKKNVANEFNIPFKDLESWMKSLTALRNCCAHHIRVWNRIFPMKPTIPKKLCMPWITNTNIAVNKLYAQLCAVRYLLSSIYPNNAFSKDLQSLINVYDNIDIKAMGFTVNWENEPLWQNE